MVILLYQLKSIIEYEQKIICLEVLCLISYHSVNKNVKYYKKKN